jgi:hypothetical protein
LLAPNPGQKFVDPVDWVIAGNAREDVGEISLWVDAVAGRISAAASLSVFLLASRNDPKRAIWQRPLKLQVSNSGPLSFTLLQSLQHEYASCDEA